MSMYQMQFDLLGDALKKIPKEPKLVNARFNVAIQVGFVDFLKWQLEGEETIHARLLRLLDESIENGDIIISYLKFELSNLSSYDVSNLFHRVICSTQLLSRSFKTFSPA